ncbi:hypothetical protein V2J09_000911 [Rumex salicifolius]
MQEKTSSIIHLCIGDETSKQIWDKLEKMYMSKSLSCKLFLKQSLYRLKMYESSNLVQHVNTFNQIIGDLGSSHDFAVFRNPNLQDFVNRTMCGKETISLDTVNSALLSHNERRQHIDGDKSQGDGLYTSNNQERGRQKEKQTNGKNKQRSKSKAKKKAVCFGCGKTCHFKRHCIN